MEQDSSFLVVYGSLSDGFTFVGPFESYDDAFAYAEAELGEWSISPIYAPAKL